MKRLLPLFFVLAFVVTWGLWAIAASLGSGPVSTALFLLGTIMPALLALALTALTDGGDAAAALIGRILQPPAALKWYAFALTYTAAIKLTAAVVHRVALGAWPAFGDTPVYLMLGAMIVSTPVQAGEEIGWRGFALPRLSRHIGVAWASLVLGVVWALWHLPLFFVAVTDTYRQSFAMFLLEVVALSVAMAWLYWRVRGALLPIMVLHAAVNNTKDIVPSAELHPAGVFALSTSRVAWITVGLFWMGAMFFLVQLRRARPALAT